MASEIQEILEFMWNNIPAKPEFNEFRQSVDARFDGIESRFDFGERIRLVEQRVVTLEDRRVGGKFEAKPAV